MKALKTYQTNVIAQGISRVFTFVGNFIVFVLVARLYGTEAFGRYSYILAFLAVFISIAEFGLTPVLAKDIAQRQVPAGLYLGNYYILRGAICLSVMVVATAAAYVLRPELFVYLLIGALSLPFLVSRFFEPIFQVFNRPWFAIYPSIIYGISYVALSWLSFTLTGDIFSILLGYIAANALYAIFAFSLSQKLVKPQFTFDKNVISAIFRLSIPIGLSAIFTIVNSRASVFILAYLKSDNDVAMYTAAFRFLELAVMVGVMVTSPLIPIFSEKIVLYPENVKQKFSRMLELLAVFSIPVIIIAPAITETLMTLFFGIGFREAAGVLNIFTCMGALTFISLICTAYALSLGEVFYFSWNTAFAAALNIALNLLLVPAHGFMGSAWASLISEFQMTAVILFFIVRRVGNVFDARRWSKIVLVNLVVYILVYGLISRIGTLFSIASALAIYLVIVFYLGLVPLDIVSEKWR